jgi:hypothetical protein
MQELRQLLDKLWTDYTTLNPSAKKIHDLFTARGEQVFNDHVAFRTYEGKVGLEAFAKPYIKAGYKPMGEYEFVQKKLFAKHFEHENPELPKIFISELKWREFSPFLQKKTEEILKQIKDSDIQTFDFSVKGRLWNISHEDYLRLADESEYAGWLSAFGFRANHFTVDVNRLKSFKSLEDLNTFIESEGFSLNSSGGKIKGTPSELLEQSSTLAKTIAVDFADGKFEVPACYYEFARRYKGKDGKLYQGFIAASADKIFESTDRQKK